ncbi:glycosyl transferase family protein [Xanthobacter sediminis]|uniref:glycosyl transferase family protein n=1 Tax=Xanthobacter sediminis TaxID=3119926 RepID=UPI0037263007
MPDPERDLPHAPHRGEEMPAPDRLGRGRLLVTLDALLATRSVTAAARQLGVQPSGVSRVLAELRLLLDDPLLIRSGRGLIPSPKAEALRPRVAAVVAEIHGVFDGVPDAAGPAPRLDDRFNRPLAHPVAPLAVQTADLSQEAPAPRRDRRPRESDEQPLAAPLLRLADAICAVGPKHKKQGGTLETAVSEDAMDIILGGEADPVQIGALFGILQLRGVTAAELAGFVAAARRHVKARFDPGRGFSVDLDWPCYLSPKAVRPPWFFHAARLLAQAGHKVVLHGNCGSGAVSGRNGLAAATLDVPVCATAAQARAAVATQGIAYIPLPDLSPQLFRLLALHGLTGSRSPVNDLVHLLCPVPARASLLGVSKPSYREIHRDVATILGQQHLGIIESTRDVAELNPFRATTIMRLAAGMPADAFMPSEPEPRALGRTGITSMEHWRGVWTGEASDPRAERIIIATAAAALMTLGGDPKAAFAPFRAEAEILWRGRNAGGAATPRTQRTGMDGQCGATATPCRPS